MKKIIAIYIFTTFTLFADTLDFGVVEVVAPKSDEGFSSSQVLSRDDLDKITSKNHSITDTLKVNPNVFFHGSLENGLNSGEIRAEDISINGAKFYQNNFLIDGINFNNDLNPDDGRDIANKIMVNVSSGSQSLNIDTDLLESIEVLDSSVSAKYGGFQGGVVKAKTRNPRKGFHGVSSFSYTSGDWTKIFYNPGEEEEYKNLPNRKDKSDFSKKRYRFGLEGYITNNFGLLFDYTKNESIMKTITKPSALDPISKLTFPNFENEVENYFFKGIWHVNDWIVVKPSYLYSLQTNYDFHEVRPKSGSNVEFGGHSFGLEVDMDFDSVFVEQSLSYKKSESSKIFDFKGQYGYAKSNIQNWGTTCNKKTGLCYSWLGGIEDGINEQESIDYSLDLNFKEFETGNFLHKINTGINFVAQKGRYKVSSPYNQIKNPKPLPDGYICEKGDLTCINDDSFDGKGQFLTDRFYLESIDNEETQKKFAFYLEDEITYKRFKVRPGIRIENDSLGDKTNLAPRFVAEYDLLNDDKNFIGFGLNRYYGRNLLAHKLYNKRDSFIQDYSRTSPDEPWKKNPSINRLDTYISTDLKTPYDDELSIYYRGELKNTLLDLKYVKRKGKNEVLAIDKDRAGLDDIEDPSLRDNYRIYTNLGKSESDIFTLALQNASSLYFLGTETIFGFTYTFMDKESNFNTYQDMFNDDLVLFEGKMIHKTELPVEDFYNRHTYKFHHNLNIPTLNLNFSNFVNVISERNALSSEWIYPDPSNKKNRYLSYLKTKVPSYAVWDMRISWLKKLRKDLLFFSNLDINNVLNKKYATNIGKIKHYGTGRNFWLEAGLKW